MKLELYTNLEGFDTLRDEWNALLYGSASNEVFLTWEWQSTWWASYQPGDLWLLTGRTDEGRLVGIAPWFLEQPSRIVRTVGCVEVTDYLDVIATGDYREAFLAALADWLVTQADQYTRISFCNIPARSATTQILPRLLTDRGFFVEVKQQEVCPIIILPPTFDDYLTALDKKQRHELRRKLRRAEDFEEKVAWYLVGREYDLNVEVDRFVALMAASHPDKARFLQDPQNAAFFRAVVPKMANCGWLQLAFLTVNGEAAATYMNFDYDNRIQVYNSGLLPQSYAHLSPGIVLLTHIIRHAIEQRKTAFDFLRGNEEYKYRMGAQDAPVMEVKATLGR